AHNLLRILSYQPCHLFKIIFMKRLLSPAYGIVLLAIVLLENCKHDSMPGPTTVKKWEAVEMKSIYEVPAPAGRTEEGEATLELLSDNSLKFTLHIHNLKSG